jgi:hypothetical protein
MIYTKGSIEYRAVEMIARSGKPYVCRRGGGWIEYKDVGIGWLTYKFLLPGFKTIEQYSEEMAAEQAKRFKRNLLRKLKKHKDQTYE